MIVQQAVVNSQYMFILLSVYPHPLYHSLRVRTDLLNP